MDLLQAQQYCERKVATSGSSFYYSFLFLPLEQRKAITALYAFCREVDDVVDNLSDPDVAHRKLQFWSEEIHTLFHGTPQHPVTIALKVHLPSIGWQQQWFEEIIAGMYMDLHFKPYANFEELFVYCYRAAGVVGMLSTHIFSQNKEPCLSFARDLGIALQLVNIIRDIGEDIRRKRIYIPLDECTRFGVDPDKLLSQAKSPELKALLGFQAQRAREYYAKALLQLPKERALEHQSALMMAAIYFQLLTVMEKESFQVLSQRYSLTPVRKCWIAWRTHRRLKKGLAP